MACSKPRTRNSLLSKKKNQVIVTQAESYKGSQSQMHLAFGGSFWVVFPFFFENENLTQIVRNGGWW